MKLPEPGLDHERHDSCDGGLRTRLSRGAPAPEVRRSPLAARTAALLARLRAARATAGAQATPAAGAGLPPDGVGWQADLQRIQLTGRLAREPLLHDVGDHRVASLQLVSERRWRTGPGTIVREHSWHRLTAWEDLADLCGRLLHAGDRIYVEGELRPISGQGGAILTYEIVLDRLILLARGPPRAGEATSPYDHLGPRWPGWKH